MIQRFQPSVDQSESECCSTGRRGADRRRSLWNAKIASSPPTVSYDAVVASHPSNAEEAEKGILRWLDKIVSSPSDYPGKGTESQDEFGFCFVEGVPPTPQATEALIQRISHIRETHCKCTAGLYGMICSEVRRRVLGLHLGHVPRRPRI